MRCSNELREILMALVDPTTDEVDFDRLAELLQTEDGALDYYTRFMDLHARLELKHDEPLPMPEIEVPAPAGRKGKAERRSRPIAIEQRSFGSLLLPAAVGVACALFVLGVGRLFGVYQAAAPHASTPPPAGEVTQVVRAASGAIVTRVNQCDWRGQAFALNDQIAAGSVIDIASGSVELRMANGALVLVEGPSEFTVESPSSGYLQVGRIACDVPKGSDGFTVRTPRATVIDLGTAFGVSVAKDGTTETHVTDGVVGLQPHVANESDDSGKVVLVSEAKGARIGADPADEPEFIEFESNLFPRFDRSELQLVGHQSGGVIRSHNQGMLFGGNPRFGTRRIGSSSLWITYQSGNMHRLSLANVVLFRLPALQPSWHVESASLEYTFKAKDGDPQFKVDLYGLGHCDLQSPRTDWFFAGEEDRSKRSDYHLGDGQLPVALIERGVLDSESPLGRRRVSNRNLVEFVRSLYDEGIQDGEAAVLRFNPDSSPTVINGVAGYNIVHGPVMPGITTPEELPVLHLTISRKTNGLAQLQHLSLPLLWVGSF